MNVIITGASKGIGKAIAEKFAADGHTIVICARGEVALYNTMDALQTAYPQCTVKARSVNMADMQQVKAFGDWLLQQNLVPDILVNNAGQFIPGSLHTENAEVLEQTMQVNLYSVHYLTRTVLPAMMKAGKGHIFNMCSIASMDAYPNGGSYSVSKFALLGYSKNLRHEMQPHGIKVTAILPGATMTASWEGSGIAPERIMEAADVADMVYASSKLSPMAVVEDIVMRPQLGDL